MWHHYMGGTLLLHIIDNKGKYTKVKIGKNIHKGEYFQYVVPANYWFASEVEDNKLKMNLNDSVSPVLVEDISDKNTYYVIMPMKI